jgi:hypothetical protein
MHADVAVDDDFKENYEACQLLISEIQHSVGGLTFARGETPREPAPARDLRRKRNERENPDGTLKQFHLSSTAANLITEDLVPPDYRVRTS